MKDSCKAEMKIISSCIGKEIKHYIKTHADGTQELVEAENYSGNGAKLITYSAGGRRKRKIEYLDDSFEEITL
jgi:hypothetical protein